MSRRLICLVCSVVLVLSLIGSAQAGEATADTFVRGAENGDINYGSGGSVTIKNSNGNGYDRKGYLRFDVGGTASEASLVLTVSTNNNGGGGTTPQTFTIEVYGLAESLDHTWVENEITWNNAPANDTASSDFTEDATLLGSFIVDPLPVGNVVSFSDPALVDFINSDTDNQITLMLRRTAGTSSSHNVAFASKENTSGYSVPTLNFKVAMQASGPNPADGDEDVSRDVTLAWMPGEFAVTHDVYFGLAFDDVNDASRANPMGVLVSQGQSDVAYTPDADLTFGQTYFWRVDEVNGAPDNAIFKGAVWSFTTEPLAYPIENVLATSSSSSGATAGPENIVNGSGLNAADEHSIESSDMWLTTPGADPPSIQFEFDKVYKLHEMLVWNYNVQFELVLGFGVKGVTVEYSADGVDWAALGDVELAQATARADYTANTMIDFGGVAARFVRLAINSGHGPMGQFGLSEVRFTFIPVQAREPQPADAATGVAADTTLAWRSGRDAVVHDVYLDTAPDAPALADTVSDNSYTPDLQFGTTYYWRIDEVNEAEAIPVWASDLWSFSTLEYVVIDDMESYDDEENTIFDTWLDGFVNGTGSTVGYFNAPFAEKTIVHSGGQSMPFEYVNDTAPFYSEAEYDLGGISLNANGADTLRVFVAGQAPAFVETADGTIVMSAIGDDIWNAADQCRYVYRQLTGDGSMTARVDSLDGASSTWAKAGAMIRQSTEAGAINTFMAMTGGDGAGATYQQRMVADDVSVSQHTYDDGPFAPPYWVRVTREGNTLLGYTSPDGETWTPRGDVITLAMTDPVLIGLALTSHNTAATTSAVFSNISFTGNVTGGWERAEIGVAQPTDAGNAIEPLYVALEDTSGNVAVVSHPNTAAVGISAWQEWLIPYSELTGVNLNRVSTMYIGVGDRDNPSSGGTGLIFIDDVNYGHPMLQP